MALSASGAGEPVLAAVGVLSGGEAIYRRRREVIRQAWASDPPPAIAVAFVLRCGGLPADAPERSEPLVLCTGVSARETRFRGPVLALLAWYRHAERAYPTASFFCKADDDVFVHLPSILSHLRAIPSSSAPFSIYGTFSWWHLLHHHARTFYFAAFAPRLAFARLAASKCGLVGRCRAVNVTCHGPFPFPNGPFFAVGRRLAAALIASPGVTDDETAFQRLPAEHGMIVEDAWLGSAVWRHVGFTAPVQLFKLGHWDRLFYDRKGFRVSTDLAIFHVRYKQLHRAIVLRHFLSLYGCVAPLRWVRVDKQDCCSSAGLTEERSLPAVEQNAAGRGSVAGEMSSMLGGMPSFMESRGLVGGRMLPPPGAEAHPWGEWQAVLDFDACQSAARSGGGMDMGGAGGGVSGGWGGASRGGARAAVASVRVGEQVDLRNVSELRRLGVAQLLLAQPSAEALDRWLKTRFA